MNVGWFDDRIGEQLQQLRGELLNAVVLIENMLDLCYGVVLGIPDDRYADFVALCMSRVNLARKIGDVPHLIGLLKWPEHEDYWSQAVTPRQLKKELEEVNGFRNALAHGSVEIDHEWLMEQSESPLEATAAEDSAREAQIRREALGGPPYRLRGRVGRTLESQLITPDDVIDFVERAGSAALQVDLIWTLLEREATVDREAFLNRASVQPTRSDETG